MKAGLLAVLSLLPACVEFNPECVPPMHDPFEIVGWLGDDFDVTRARVRTTENAFGSLVADAYFDAFTDRAPGQRADVAFENAGAIRDEGFCLPRTLVERGALTRRVLREVLPFDDKVLLVTVTGEELRGIFEHAVSRSGLPGTAGQPGFFLHFSTGEATDSVVEVDCSSDFAAERLANTTPPTVVAEGQRIRKLVLGGVDVIASPTAQFRVAVNNFLVDRSFNDNFVDLRAKEAVDQAPSLNFQVVEDFVRRKGAKDAPLRAPQKGRLVLSPTCVR